MLEPGNQPRWRGQAGFFEVWFLVMFVPKVDRALWLRYTLFAPARGQPAEPRATVWAAAFDAGAATPAVALKSILPIHAYQARADGPFGIRIGDTELGGGVCRGSVRAGGHALTWDLGFTPQASPDHRTSLLLSHRLPLPTRVVHAHEGVRVRGTFSLDGRTVQVDDAPALQKHLWGNRRVEELFWIYCPLFREDASARLEVTSARASRELLPNVPFPSVSPIWLETSSGPWHFFGARHLLRNAVHLAAPSRLRARAWSALRALEIEADCDPATLVGYVYRDPGGGDRYVAQSDLANCRVTLLERARPFGAFHRTRTLTSTHGAALEVHLPQPLEGVRYVGWDETARGEDEAERTTA